MPTLGRTQHLKLVEQFHRSYILTVVRTKKCLNILHSFGRKYRKKKEIKSMKWAHQFLVHPWLSSHNSISTPPIKADVHTKSLRSRAQNEHDCLGPRRTLSNKTHEKENETSPPTRKRIVLLVVSEVLSRIKPTIFRLQNSFWHTNRGFINMKKYLLEPLDFAKTLVRSIWKFWPEFNNNCT